MSKIGKRPISLPKGVEVDIKKNKLLVKGPKGQLDFVLPREVLVAMKDNSLVVYRASNSKLAAALHGTTRSIIDNMVKGVSDGWKKELEVVGTGYRAEVSSDGKLILNVGYSHPVEVKPIEGVRFLVDKTKIIVEGLDKQKVGQVAAKVRSIRPPEPYKGKGIKYVNEVIRRKAGKAAKSQSA